MKGESVYKVPNGKLVKISLESDEGIIRAISITGDFFIHPEEGIDIIEKGIRGKKISGDLENEIMKSIENKGIVMVGINAEAIAHAIRLAAGVVI